jgi:hypothetical protein
MGHNDFFILTGSDVKGFDDELGRTVSVKVLAQLLPQGSPVFVGQNLALPGAVEKRSGFAPQSLNNVAVVDAAGAPVCATAGSPDTL